MEKYAKYTHVLESCPLFAEIGGDGLVKLMKCLSASSGRFEKNSFIFLAGESVPSAGIVLSGAVHVIMEDFWGNRAIMARLEPGELFGEAFQCAGLQKLPVSAQATETSEILSIDLPKALSPCSEQCHFHLKFIRNMIRALAEKNILLTQKIGYVTRRTIREKLMSYLSFQASQTKAAGRENQDKIAFKIPFSRQELADYLSADRSALSAELGRMRDEGILSFEKNRFVLFGSKRGRDDGSA
jgi:CRP-like cAMP-binding protein